MEVKWNVRVVMKNCVVMCLDFSYYCLIIKEMNVMIEVCVELKYI